MATAMRGTSNEASLSWDSAVKRGNGRSLSLSQAFSELGLRALPTIAREKDRLDDSFQTGPSPTTMKVASKSSCPRASLPAMLHQRLRERLSVQDVLFRHHHTPSDTHFKIGPEG